MTQEDLLAFYTAPGIFTRLDGFEREVAGIAGDAGSVAHAVQGLLIHEGLIAAYGVSPTTERAREKQLHGAVAMLTLAARLDPRPVNQPRSPEKRVIGVCRHFATLFVTLMRGKGVPARARCGFANYFEPGKYCDHWVGEYWNANELRWVLVDAQIDELQRGLFGLTFDPLDVPRDRFLVGGDAWRACRDSADPMSFGVAGTKMWGLVEVYGDLFQDLAALQNIELLPWGWYGMATDENGMAEVALVDRLAVISSSADAPALIALREALAGDNRLHVPQEMLATIISNERVATGA